MHTILFMYNPSKSQGTSKFLVCAWIPPHSTSALEAATITHYNLCSYNGSPLFSNEQGSSKMEKAEILQMTVDHLKMLHAIGDTGKKKQLTLLKSLPSMLCYCHPMYGD